MPVHDWTRVDVGIFHDFHQSWICEIHRALNGTLLPRAYYALAEQHSARFEPDVLTLKSRSPNEPGPSSEPADADFPRNGGPFDATEGRVMMAEPKVRIRAETDLEFYRREQNVVAVRHASGDELVAVVEIVSRGNKSGRVALEDFVGKTAEFLGHRVHLLIVDLQPPTLRDPQGIHGRIWEDITGEEYTAPLDKPLTLAAYEAGAGIRAFIEPIAVGDVLSPMPLFLRPEAYVLVPLEEIYQAAWDAVPRRWRGVIERP